MWLTKVITSVAMSTAFENVSFSSGFEIQIAQSNTPVTIKLHDKTCASYLTILHTALGLQVGLNINNVYTNT